MPARSKIDLLPAAMRQRLEAKIITNGFGGYRDLAAWLSEQGYRIAKDSVHRHGQQLKRKLEAVKRATGQPMISCSRVSIPSRTQPGGPIILPLTSRAGRSVLIFGLWPILREYRLRHRPDFECHSG